MLENYALVRKPGNSVVNGLKLKNYGEVDAKKAKLQHQNYRIALYKMGFQPIILPPEEKYPDSVFVEDPAVVAKNTLVVARLTKKERRGEESLLEKTLASFFDNIQRIEEPGYLEGGDVLITENGAYIGLSGRTNFDGAQQLAKILYKLCFKYTTFLELPSDMLHLKGAMSYHCVSREKSLIMISEELHSLFKNKVNLERENEILVTPAEERFGANCINSGKHFLIHANRPKTKALLKKRGYCVTEIDLSEFEKIDGAMTCLSKFLTLE